MNEVSLHRDDVITILQFINKYPDSEYVTITSDSSSGIGSLIKANVKTILYSDFVTITKNIVDESEW